MANWVSPCVVSGSEEHEHTYAWDYNPSADSFTQKFSYDFNSSFGASAAMFESDYRVSQVCGFKDSSQDPVNWHRCWNLSTWTHVSRKSHPESKFDATSKSENPQSRVACGRSDTAIVNSHHKFVSATNTWSTEPVYPPGKRFRAGSFAIPCFIAFAGNDGYGSKQDAYKFDETTGSWVQLANTGHAATVRNSSGIYSRKGLFSIGSVTKLYNMDSNTWSSKATTTSVDWSSAMTLVKLNSVDSFCKYNGTEHARYDLTSNSWSNKTAVPSACGAPIAMNYVRIYGWHAGTLKVGGENFDILWNEFGPSETDPLNDTEVEGTWEDMHVELAGVPGSYASEGTFTSGVIDLGENQLLYKVQWEATEPYGTEVDTVSGPPKTISVRASSTPPQTDKNGDPWSNLELPNDSDPVWGTAGITWWEVENGQQVPSELQCRYVQFRATLRQTT